MHERVAASKAAPKFKQLPVDAVIAKTRGEKQLRFEPLTNLKAPVAKAITKAEASDGSVLFESFEGWDGQTVNWVPEGWTLENKGEIESGDETWTPFYPIRYYPGPADGECFMGIFYSDKFQDEWLISPEVSLGEGMQLSYYILIEPLWFYNLDKMDWYTYEFEGEKEIIYTVQVLVKPEGAEDWTVLRDYAEEYLDYSGRELMQISPSELEKHSVSLAEYSGQKVKVAFRYTGTDGQSVFIDAINIGLPSLENICYINPTNTLYWGYSNDADMLCLTADMALYPVYSPLTWVNYSEDAATFTWTYNDPETGEDATSDNQEELTVTYKPDYSSEETIMNNLYEFPTLTAVAPGSSPSSYTDACIAFQAGGKSSYPYKGGYLDLSLFPFALNQQGVTDFLVSDDKLGAYAIPVFGYNMFSNDYWLSYSLNEEEYIYGDYAKLVGTANIFWPSSDAPLVVNGMSVYGFGRIADDVELTASIYALNENLSTDLETFTLIGRSTITGKDILSDGLDGSKGDLCLPFKFEEPVVVQASDEHPVFVFMLEGINNDKIEYWSPYLSEKPDQFGRSYGYTLNHINLKNHIGRDPYYSFRKLRYIEDGDYLTYEGSFAIGLDAEYPWLTTDAEKVEFAADETTVTVALGSYYDGSKLTVEAPEGVSAKVEGRYNECVLTVTREAGASIDGNVTISGPGVKVVLPVVAGSGTTGIEEIGVNADVEAIYDLSGRKIVSPEAGIYLVKYSDGKVCKVTVK